LVNSGSCCANAGKHNGLPKPDPLRGQPRCSPLSRTHPMPRSALSTVADHLADEWSGITRRRTWRCLACRITARLRRCATWWLHLMRGMTLPQSVRLTVLTCAMEQFAWQQNAPAAASCNAPLFNSAALTDPPGRTLAAERATPCIPARLHDGECTLGQFGQCQYPSAARPGCWCRATAVASASARWPRGTALPRWPECARSLTARPCSSPRP
jgi:hypothetical protein